ncbi:hypothetical protein ACGFJT_41870 [Actinomadura geliboluensis]|uniref:hypothetical protein n=1 Tax=Actinomadura geliboluensis TaxID=882440 RepID=UPI003716EB92
MAVSPRIQARIDQGLADWLNDRAARMRTGSHNEQARIEVQMWRSALASELGRVRLTLPQLSCIADVMNGSHLEAIIGLRPGLVYAACHDAFTLARRSPLPEESSYADKWNIDEEALLRYLAEMSVFADHALVDAMSRWWAGGHEATIEGFAAVGLRVLPTTAA